MVMEVWRLPAHSTVLVEEPELVFKLGRECAVSYQSEDDFNSELKSYLTFEDVQALKVNYLGSVRVDIIRAAYDRLVDWGESSWLLEIRTMCSGFFAMRNNDPVSLKHLVIYFDDGPSYEFICTGFRLEKIHWPPAAKISYPWR